MLQLFIPGAAKEDGERAWQKDDILDDLEDEVNSRNLNLADFRRVPKIPRDHTGYWFDLERCTRIIAIPRKDQKRSLLQRSALRGY